MNTFVRVMTKASKHLAAVESEYLVAFPTKDSIVVCRERKEGDYSPEKEFRVGDVAEYDSYNLIYTGKIVKISGKTVSILPKYGKKVKRLSLHEFAWRNFDFDVAEVAAKNFDTMMYI